VSSGSVGARKRGITVFTISTAALAAHVAGPFGWHPWPGLFILVPLFWILLFVAIFAIFGRRHRRRMWNEGWGHWGPMGTAARHAEVTLAERFAQGDIDEKEYRARLEVLRANAMPPGSQQ
jgi:putative membrane protein